MSVVDPLSSPLVALADASVEAPVLARRLLVRHSGRDGVVVRQVCGECGGPHGRPQVVGADAHVGWSRSAGVVAAVVADEPCAIDVQALDPLRTQGIPLDLCSPGERDWVVVQADPVRAFTGLWVRKEVLVKLGEVTLDEALAVDVRASLDGRPVLGRTLVELDATAYDAVAAWGR